MVRVVEMEEREVAMSWERAEGARAQESARARKGSRGVTREARGRVELREG